MFLEKIKKRSKLVASILVSNICLMSVTGMNNCISFAESSSDTAFSNDIYDITENTISNMSDDNDFTIKASLLDNKLYINKLDSNNSITLSKELFIEDNFDIESNISLNTYGFSVLLKSNTYKSTDSIQELNHEDTEQKTNNQTDEFNYRILLFDNNLELIKDNIYTNSISNNYLFKLFKDEFNILDSDTISYLNTLSEDDIYNLSIYLVSIAEKTLHVNDINDAKLVIDMLESVDNKDALLNKLNIIASESIDEELDNPNSNLSGNLNNIIDNTLPILSDSYIDLSVNTNNITFDYLNLSEDTTIYNAITLDVSSSLPYDINISIEGDISSSTNSTPLDKSVFSIKESSSSNYLTFDDSGIINLLQSQTAGDFISHSFDLRLNTKTHVIKDIYKAVFKVEAITK
ncbi:MAG: hypothetical protein IJ086_11380 [Clostridium sp.]|nr:hypothetical protein [Clostridium sp.]